MHNLIFNGHRGHYISKYSGNQIAVLDTDNLIELFNKDFEHVESVRTSVWFSNYDEILNKATPVFLMFVNRL